MRAQHDGAGAPEGGIGEIFRESLGLGLGANENRDSKNDPAKTENEGAFAMEKKSQRDMKGWRHSGFSWRMLLTMRCLTNCPGAQLILVRNHYAIAFLQAGEHFGEIERAIPDS